MKLKHFIRFLKEEKAYLSYRKTLLEQSYHNKVKKLFLEGIKSNNDIENLICFIIGAFSWSTTKEGYDYWSKLNYKWSKYYTKYKNVL